MMSKIFSYKIHEVTPYINWIYFFHAWGFAPRFATIANIKCCYACRAMWLTTFVENDRPKASEALQLYKDAERILKLLDKDYEVQSIVKLCKAYADGDDIILDGIRIPLLRQQKINNDNSPNLCLSDFIRQNISQENDKIGNTVGVFASSVDEEIAHLYQNDPYKSLLIQTLSDRLAEAATEKMHEDVRKNYWGYASDENLSMPDLLLEKFQGIRPAVGYPSLPDQSVNFLIDEILSFRSIGITLTENGAMHPHASVSGLMFAHPQSQYFSIGKIGHDQLNDYAKRRGLSMEEVRKYLSANLKE